MMSPDVSDIVGCQKKYTENQWILLENPKLYASYMSIRLVSWLESNSVVGAGG